MSSRENQVFTTRLIRILVSVIVIASLLAGCNLPWQLPTEEEDAATKEAEQEETSEPHQDLPPALVEVSPIPNSVIPLQESITLYFNQAMDVDSVEAAISFTPSTSGSFSWEDDQILTFTPDQPLAPGTDLTLTISTNAQAVNNMTLQEPIELAFQTAENLQVIQSVPSAGVVDVDPESAVFVSFNQPVVALGAEASDNPAFTLAPDVPGEGEWINTSTYIFYPSPTMNGGTDYTIELNESLTGTYGAGLDPSQELEFEFTTTQPTISKVLPLSNEKLSLDGPIELIFNMRMNPDSVADHFKLLDPSGDQVPGSLEWDEDYKTASFTPDENLERSTTYTIYLDSNAESFGGLPIDAPVEITRTTYPAFAIDPSYSSEFESYYGQYGQYQIVFTTPIDREEYKDHIIVSPEVAGFNAYLSDQDTSMTVNGYFSPETRYTITVDNGLQDIWGGQLNSQVTYTFYTPPATPSLTVITGYTSYNLVFIPASESELAMQATNVNTVTLEISPISMDDLMTLIHPDNYNYRQAFLPPDLEETTRNVNLTPNVSEVITIPLSYQEQPLSSGVYFLRISSADVTYQGSREYTNLFLIVSDNNVVMKIAPEQVLLWATQLNDYAPLSDASVSVYNTEGDQIASGYTDADGLFESEVERPDEAYGSFFSIIGEPGDADFAFSISTWGMGYSLYEMGIPLNTYPKEIEAYVYTDRPIYRPGDTVDFKAVIFSRDNGLPAPSGLESVTVTAYTDPGMSGISSTVYVEDLQLSTYETVEDSFLIPEDSPTGFYRIEFSVGENFFEAFYFNVSEYRKPDFEVSVDLGADDILAGEDLTVEIQADYYFGLPTSNQAIIWTLYQDEMYFHLPGYQVGPVNTDWLMPTFDYYMIYGTSVAYGEDETDNQGHITLDFSVGDLELDNAAPGSLQKYTLEATITDESGLPVSQRESVLIHPEDFYIGVQPEQYFGQADSEFPFSILTVDWDQEPVGGVALEATFEAIEWTYEPSLDPGTPYKYTAQTTFIASASPVTDGDGHARVAFTPPEPGTYQLTLEGGDAVTQTIIWVSGSGTAVWPRQTQNLLKLTPDAEEYEPGQTAQVFFANPFEEGAKALITIERGTVMDIQVIDIEDAGYTLTIPLDEKSAPNIYVSVTLLGKTANGAPDYRQGFVNLAVTPVTQTLNVNLFIDPEQTEPGESVSATLTITDSQGNPVQGEFSIAVVDKALLALVEPNSDPILVALYGKQSLSVQTSLSLRTYATQLTLTSLEGGGGGGDMELSGAVREEFPDTAYWVGMVVTGVDGKAQLTIPLPDTLTTWVVDVRGLTEDFLVGQAEAEILTQKDLMIQPITPRFLVDGDEVEMAALVFNNTAKTLSVDVTIHGVGYSLINETDQTQQVSVEPGDSVRVDWLGSIESVDSVDLTFSAVSGALSDASKPEWGELEVMHYIMPYTFSTAGQLTEEGQRLELVSLPISTDPSSGELTLELIPSLTAALAEGLEALEASPYNDIASILSRLITNLGAFQALTELGIDTQELEVDLEELIVIGTQDLLSAQNYDGGWSWWASADVYTRVSNPFLTAYAIMALDMASEAGMDVSEYAYDLAVSYLFANLQNPGEVDSTWQLDRLTFEVYALRKGDLVLDSYLSSLYNRRGELSPWSSALLALAMHDVLGPSDRVNTLISGLEAQAIRSSTGVHWESDQPFRLLPGSTTFNTSVGVYALAQLDPASASLPLALRYLIVHQETGRLWSSPFESAWALMAIIEALRGTGDYQADYNYQATLNDIVIAEGTAEGTVPLNVVTATTSIDDLFTESPNALTFERGEGTGTLYYRVDLETYVSASDAEAINKGISLQRDYYIYGENCPSSGDCEPITSIVLDLDDPDQLITVSLTVIISHDMYNLMIEDFIPAGTEIVNQEFLTSQTVYEETVSFYNPYEPFSTGWGWWFFNEPQIYDDHLLWTADYLPAGTYTLTYQLLPYQRGVFQVLPTHAWQYFYPEVQGTSEGDLLTIN